MKVRKQHFSDIILWPAKYKTGNFVYPYSKARR
jgi:hypothetical protein